MNILHVIPRYPPAIGGAEHWCQGVARWQAAHDHQVDVLTLRAVTDDDLWAEPGQMEGPLAVGTHDCDQGVRVRRCTLGGRAGPGISSVFGVVGALALTRAHSAELYGRLVTAARKADIVHVHSVPGPHVYAAWLAARARRRPIVLTPYFHAGEPWFEHPTVRWILRRVDALFSLSRAEAVALAANGATAERIVDASNAIDWPPAPDPSPARERIRTALRVPSGSPLLLFVGRKAASKNVDLILRALPLVRHRPRAVLALVGPATAWYQTLGDLTRNDGVRDLPLLSPAAKAELLAAADLLVLPSKAESFGTVFLEAWSRGTAVIGAEIPAVREVIGDAGLTFRPDDAVDLAARIDELLAVAEAASAMVERGRQRIAARHTWTQVGEAVMRGYDLVGGCGTRRRTEER